MSVVCTHTLLVNVSLLLSPSHRQGHWNSETTSDFSKVKLLLVTKVNLFNFKEVSSFLSKAYKVSHWGKS